MIVASQADPSVFLSTLAGTLAVCFTIGFAVLVPVAGEELLAKTRTRIGLAVLVVLDLGAVAAPVAELWWMALGHVTSTAWTTACGAAAAVMVAINVGLLLFSSLFTTARRVIASLRRLANDERRLEAERPPAASGEPGSGADPPGSCDPCPTR